MQKRENLDAVKLLAAVEEVQLDHEAQTGDISAQRFGELHTGVGRAAGRKQVINHNNALARADSVLMDLERINAVFELVIPLDGVRRELAGLADGHESGVQAIGERGTKDEATGLDSQDQVDFRAEIVFGQSINQRREADVVFEKRGDVVEQNAFLGEVGNFADQLLQVLAVVRHLPCSFNAKSIEPGYRVSRQFLYFINAGGARPLLQFGA